MPNIIKFTAKYTKNIAKSLGYVVADYVGEKNPILKDMAEANKETTKILFESVKDFKGTAKKVKTNISDSEYFKVAVAYKNNLFDDLKTGKFYNKEREDKIFNAVGNDMLGDEGENISFSYSDSDFGLGDSDDSDGDFGFDDDDTDVDDSSFSFDDGDTIGEKITTGISSATIKSADYVSKVSRANAGMLAANIEKLGAGITNGFGAMSGHLSNMQRFNDEVLKTHVENSVNFYTRSVQLDEERNELLKQIVENQKAVSGTVTDTDSNTQRKTINNFIKRRGVVDIGELVKFGATNIKGMINDYTSMLDPSGTGSGLMALAASPLQLPIQLLLDTLTPKSLNDSFKKFNENLSTIAGNLVLKFSEKLDDMALGDTIRDIFRIDNTVYNGINTGNYAKGALPWNGKSEKALTEVIPDLLSSINAGVNGVSFKRFDYDSGTYQDIDSIRQELKDKVTNTYDNNNYKLLEELTNELKLFELDQEKMKEYLDGFKEVLTTAQESRVHLNPNTLAADEEDKFINIEDNIRSMMAVILKNMDNKNLINKFNRDNYFVAEDINSFFNSINTKGGGKYSIAANRLFDDGELQLEKERDRAKAIKEGTIINKSYREKPASGLDNISKSLADRLNSLQLNTNQNNILEIKDNTDRNIYDYLNAILNKLNGGISTSPNNIQTNLNPPGNSGIYIPSGSKSINPKPSAAIFDENGNPLVHKRIRYPLSTAEIDRRKGIFRDANGNIITDQKLIRSLRMLQESNIKIMNPSDETYARSFGMLKTNDIRINKIDRKNTNSKVNNLFNNRPIQEYEEEVDPKEAKRIKEQIRRSHIDYKIRHKEKLTDDEFQDLDPEEQAEYWANIRAEMKEKEENEKIFKDAENYTGEDDESDGPVGIVNTVKDFFNKGQLLMQKPADVITHVLDVIDKRIYEMLYGDEVKYKGIMDKIIHHMSELFGTAGDWIKDNIFEPFFSQVLDGPIKKIKDFFGIEDKIDDEEKEKDEDVDIKDDTPKDRSGGLVSKLGNTVKETLTEKQNTKLEEEIAQFVQHYNVKYHTNITKEKVTVNTKAKPHNYTVDGAKYDINGNKLGLASSIIPETVVSNALKDEEVDGQAAKGMKSVPKTGIYALSKGEMVIPVEKNPYYDGPISSKRSQLLSEKDAINKFKLGGENIEGFAEGTDDNVVVLDSDQTITATLDDESIKSIGEQLKSTMSAVWDKIKGTPSAVKTGVQSARERLDKGEGTGFENTVDTAFITLEEGVSNVFKMGKAFSSEVSGKSKDDINKSVEKAKLTGKKILEDLKSNPGSMIAGAGIGAIATLLTGIGGPLIGAAAGSILGLVKESENLKDMIFGTYDAETDERYGGLIKNQKVKNFIFKKLPGMAAGGTLGSIISLLPFIPGGPLAGFVLGSGVQLASKSEKVTDFLFGRTIDDTGKRYGGLLGDPGPIKNKIKKLLPNMSVGAVAGLLAGPFGLVGNLVFGSAVGYATTTDKFKELLLGKEVTDKNGETHREGGLAQALRDNVIEPLKTSIQPIAKQIQLGFKSAFDKLKDMLESIFKTYVGLPLNRFLIEKVFKPIGSAVGNVASALMKPITSIATAPFRAIGAVGKHYRRKQIAQGNADYMTAEERLAYRKEQGLGKFGLLGRDKTEDFDTALAGMTQSDIKSLSSAFSVATNSKDVLKKQQYDAKTNIMTKVNNMDLDYDTANHLNKILQKGNYNDAIEFVRNNISDSGVAKEAADTIMSEMTNLKGVQNATENTTEYRKHLYNKLRSEFGIDVNDKNIGKFKSLVDREIDPLKEEVDPVEEQTKQQKEHHDELIDYIKEITHNLSVIADPNNGDKKKALDDYYKGKESKKLRSQLQSKGLLGKYTFDKANVVNTDDQIKLYEYRDLIKNGEWDGLSYDKKKEYIDNINGLFGSDYQVNDPDENDIFEDIRRRIMDNDNNEDISNNRLRAVNFDYDKLLKFRGILNNLAGTDKELKDDIPAADWVMALKDSLIANEAENNKLTQDTFGSRVKANASKAFDIVRHPFKAIGRTVKGTKDAFSRAGKGWMKPSYDEYSMATYMAEMANRPDDKYSYSENGKTRTWTNDDGNRIQEIQNSDGEWEVDLRDKETRTYFRKKDENLGIFRTLGEGISNIKDRFSGFVDAFFHKEDGSDTLLNKILKGIGKVALIGGGLLTGASAYVVIRNWWREDGKAGLLNWWSEGPSKTIAEFAYNHWDTLGGLITKVINGVTNVYNAITGLPAFAGSLWEGCIQPFISQKVVPFYKGGIDLIFKEGLPWLANKLIANILDVNNWIGVGRAIFNGIKSVWFTHDKGDVDYATGAKYGDDITSDPKSITEVTDAWLKNVQDKSNDQTANIVNEYMKKYTSENVAGKWTGSIMYQDVLDNFNALRGGEAIRNTATKNNSGSSGNNYKNGTSTAYGSELFNESIDNIYSDPNAVLYEGEDTVGGAYMGSNSNVNYDNIENSYGYTQTRVDNNGNRYTDDYTEPANPYAPVTYGDNSTYSDYTQDTYTGSTYDPYAPDYVTTTNQNVQNVTGGSYDSPYVAPPTSSTTDTTNIDPLQAFNTSQIKQNGSGYTVVYPSESSKALKFGQYVPIYDETTGQPTGEIITLRDAVNQNVPINIFEAADGSMQLLYANRLKFDQGAAEFYGVPIDSTIRDTDEELGTGLNRAQKYGYTAAKYAFGYGGGVNRAAAIMGLNGKIVKTAAKLIPAKTAVGKTVRGLVRGTGDIMTGFGGAAKVGRSLLTGNTSSKVAAVEGLTSKFIKFLFDNRMVKWLAKKLAKDPNSILKLKYKVYNFITKKFSKLLTTGIMKKATAVISAIIPWVPLVQAIADGLFNANSILGITGSTTFGEKLLATLVGVINNYVLGGLFAPEDVIDFVMGILDMFGVKLPGGLAGLQRRRQESKEELNQYNIEHGTNYTMRDYNQNVKGGWVGKVQYGFRQFVAHPLSSIKKVFTPKIADTLNENKLTDRDKTMSMSDRMKEDKVLQAAIAKINGTSDESIVDTYVENSDSTASTSGYDYTNDSPTFVGDVDTSSIDTTFELTPQAATMLQTEEALNTMESELESTKNIDNSIVDKVKKGNASVTDKKYWDTTALQIKDDDTFADYTNKLIAYYERTLNVPVLAAKTAMKNLDTDMKSTNDELKKSLDSISTNSRIITASGSRLSAKGSSNDDFVSQTSGPYANMKYGNSTIKDAGCAPTTAMMAVEGLTGAKMGINEATKIAKTGGYLREDGSTDIGYFKDAFESKGLKTDYYFAGNSNDTLVRKIQSNQETVLMGQDPMNTSKRNSPFGPGNHYVLAKGMDGNGNIIVRDPENTQEMVYPSSILKNVKAAVGVSHGGRGSMDRYRFGMYGGDSKDKENAKMSKIFKTIYKKFGKEPPESEKIREATIDGRKWYRYLGIDYAYKWQAESARSLIRTSSNKFGGNGAIDNRYNKYELFDFSAEELLHMSKSLSEFMDSINTWKKTYSSEPGLAAQYDKQLKELQEKKRVVDLVLNNRVEEDDNENYNRTVDPEYAELMAEHARYEERQERGRAGTKQTMSDAQLNALYEKMKSGYTPTEYERKQATNKYRSTETPVTVEDWTTAEYQRKARDPECIRKQNLGSFSPINDPDDVAQFAKWWDKRCKMNNSKMVGKSGYFLDASAVSGLDPRYIAAHFALETKWGTSAIFRDKHNGFGISAYDNSAYSSAKTFADDYDGIVKGALWIAENYYHGDFGQTNLYEMRWGGDGWHQYATAVTWDTSIAEIMSNSEIPLNKNISYDAGEFFSTGEQLGSSDPSALKEQKSGSFFTQLNSIFGDMFNAIFPGLFDQPDELDSATYVGDGDPIVIGSKYQSIYFMEGTKFLNQMADASKVVSTANKYVGRMKYQFGANNYAGLVTDCSAFVQGVYKEAKNVDIGRNTSTQVDNAKNNNVLALVNADEVSPGDLVYFTGTQSNKGPDEPSHAGIVVSRGSDPEIVHNGSSDIGCTKQTLSEINLPVLCFARIPDGSNSSSLNPIRTVSSDRYGTSYQVGSNIHSAYGSGLNPDFSMPDVSYNGRKLTPKQIKAMSSGSITGSGSGIAGVGNITKVKHVTKTHTVSGGSSNLKGSYEKIMGTNKHDLKSFTKSSGSSKKNTNSITLHKDAYNITDKNKSTNSSNKSNRAFAPNISLSGGSSNINPQYDDEYNESIELYGSNNRNKSSKYNRNYSGKASGNRTRYIPNDMDPAMAKSLLAIIKLLKSINTNTNIASKLDSLINLVSTAQSNNSNTSGKNSGISSNTSTELRLNGIEGLLGNLIGAATGTTEPNVSITNLISELEAIAGQ